MNKVFNYENNIKPKNNQLLSSSKKTNTNKTRKRNRFLSMNESTISSVISNSMEENKNINNINLDHTKLKDNKVQKNSSVKNENKTNLKLSNAYSLKNNSTGQKNISHINNKDSIPLPNNIAHNAKINNNTTLKSKINSSLLFNVKDNKLLDNGMNNSSHNPQHSEKEENALKVKDSANTNNIPTNQNYHNPESNRSKKDNSSKEKEKQNKLTLENKSSSSINLNSNISNNIINNNITNHNLYNISHNKIPNIIPKRNDFSPREKTKNNNILASAYNLNMKVVDELSNYKLKNTKLENEILLLNEKIKCLNQNQVFYTNENDILKSKLTDLQEDYKKDLENLKKYKQELNQAKNLNIKFTQNIKSSINILLDIVEIFLSPRSINPKQSTIYNENNSYSIDIYDSYNNEEERRNIVFDQIQNLLISKFNIMKKTLNVNFDVEIEKVKNWSANLFANKSNNNDINVSNIKLSIKNYESSSYESSKKNSQDFFDLSISNQFLKHNSPKFNNSFGIENDNGLDKGFKLISCEKKPSNTNLISPNVFNTNNFLSAGNISLNNITLNNVNNQSNFSNNKTKDNNTSIANINNLSISNMNSNTANIVNSKENNEEKLNLNLNFNDSFLKDLNSAQYDSFQNENRGKFENENNDEINRINRQIRESVGNNEDININIEDCSIININAENKDNVNTQNINKNFSFDLNDDPSDFNNEFIIAPSINPLHFKEKIENETKEKENQNLSFRETNSVKEFIILPPTIINTK